MKETSLARPMYLRAGQLLARIEALGYPDSQMELQIERIVEAFQAVEREALERVAAMCDDGSLIGQAYARDIRALAKSGDTLT